MNNLWYQCYQLITAVNDFAECLNEGGQCDVLTLDFSKAFDKVPHAQQYQKLFLYGIRGPILTWLQAFLTRSHLIQNSQAVKKECGPEKGYGEKRCEIQGGGQEMAVMVG